MAKLQYQKCKSDISPIFECQNRLMYVKQAIYGPIMNVNFFMSK